LTNIVIWHNPRCSKSRQTLALLQENGVTPEARLYLKDLPTLEELSAIQSALGLPARDMTRLREAAFAEQGLTKTSTDGEILQAMTRAPILIERPIVIHGDRAAIGRPPEAVLALL